MIKSLLNKWEYFITSMSEPRQKVIDIYDNIYGKDMKAQNFEYHICKVMLYGHKNHNLFDRHWAVELYAFISDSFGLTLKPKNKYPKVDFILEYFFYKRMDSLETFKIRLDVIEDRCMSDLKDPYPKGKNIDYNKAWKLYQEFSNSCASDLSMKGIIEREDFYKYLKPLYDVD